MATIKKGTYRWIDNPDFSINYISPLDMVISIPPTTAIIDGEEYHLSFDKNYTGIAVVSTPDEIFTNAPLVAFNSENGASPNLIANGSIVDELGALLVFQNGVLFEGYGGLGHTFTLEESYTFTDEYGIAFATWFDENTTAESAFLRKFTRLYIGNVISQTNNKVLKKLNKSEV